jgi:hypothetical protein
VVVVIVNETSEPAGLSQTAGSCDRNARPRFRFNHPRPGASSAGGSTFGSGALINEAGARATVEEEQVPPQWIVPCHRHGPPRQQLMVEDFATHQTPRNLNAVEFS